MLEFSLTRQSVCFKYLSIKSLESISRRNSDKIAYLDSQFRDLKLESKKLDMKINSGLSNLDLKYEKKFLEKDTNDQEKNRKLTDIEKRIFELENRESFKTIKNIGRKIFGIMKAVK